jgi:RND family efflux transporter MFP subunit
MTATTSSSRWRVTTGAFAIAAAIAFGTSAALHARVGGETATGGRPPLPVSVTAFREQDGYRQPQRFLGLVQAATRSNVGFEVPGTIARIAVREGDTVAAGSVLATLDLAAVESRLSAARATVAQIDSELELAHSRTERQRPLAQNGAIPAQTFDDTRLAEQALQSALEAARARLQAVEIEAGKATLRAPYDAIIGRQLLDEGAVTQPGVAVFSLIASDAREAHIGVAVEQAQHLTPGSAYSIEWRGNTYSATLRAIRPDVNPVSMTTVAIFDLPTGLNAYDGEPVAVSLPRRVAITGGWLPLSSLLEGKRGTWTVLRLDGSDAALVALREVVEVLYTGVDQVYVRGTLRDGDRVIADGVHRITPGTRVRVAKG